MANEGWKPAWFRGYASDFYDWHALNLEDRTHYWRRIGLVESFFDMDGTGYEGRADLNMNLVVETRTSLDLPALRTRLALAWSIMRQRHVLLSARAVQLQDLSRSEERGQDRVFVFTPSSSVDDLLDEGRTFLDFLEDSYPDADQDDFYTHLMNTGRAIDASKACSRCLVMPFKHSTESTFPLRIVIVAGHQIADGLTTFRLMNSLISLLNSTDAELQSFAKKLVRTTPTTRLPPAQETLYPPVSASPARRRWFWLITRILRHTSHTNPTSFQNPLRRSKPLPRAKAFSPKYPLLLNYAKPPTNNAHTLEAKLSSHASARLIALCRQTSISIGSGLFTLVALTMMLLNERLRPDTPLRARLPFTGSFPLNPRPFLADVPAEAQDSLMLAFSDGITLPFLPSHLPFEGRFKLLGRQAHRQLRSYQKRRRSEHEELALGAKSSKFLLPTFYLQSLERFANRMRLTGSGDVVDAEPEVYDFQGVYKPAAPGSLATCGISSVGDRTALISSGKYSLGSEALGKEGKDLAVDFRNMWSFVRPRDGEFLVGAAGSTDTEDGRMRLGFGVSFDGNVIDVGRVGEWRGVIEGLLEGRGEEGEEGLERRSSKL